MNLADFVTVAGLLAGLVALYYICGRVYLKGSK